MLRSPRTRLTAIKYLDLKIPKNIDEAASINPTNSEEPDSTYGSGEAPSPYIKTS